jgi:transketolase
MELLSKVHARNLIQWAKDKPEVLVLSADLTASTEIDLFKEAYPERFLSMGIAEQNMISFAGGLAREGYFPFIHTFGVFIYRRAYDQVAMSVAYPNLPVRLVGFLPGITTPGGATHQAIEDIALMRALPNMTILECGDATEVETVLEVTQNIPGPVYIRMLRGEIPRLFDRTQPMRLGEARVLSQGHDIVLISSGICTEEAMRATKVLAERGVSIFHLHISTLKPFNNAAIIEAAAQAGYGVITMENHTIIGGLGSIVAEALAESGLGRKLVRIGLQDTFAHGASRPYLMREYGLDALALVHHVEKLIGRSFSITEKDLAAVRLEAVHSQSKAEAL